MYGIGQNWNEHGLVLSLYHIIDQYVGEYLTLALIFIDKVVKTSASLTGSLTNLYSITCTLCMVFCKYNVDRFIYSVIKGLEFAPL